MWVNRMISSCKEYPQMLFLNHLIFLHGNHITPLFQYFLLYKLLLPSVWAILLLRFPKASYLNMGTPVESPKFLSGKEPACQCRRYKRLGFDI